MKTSPLLLPIALLVLSVAYAAPGNADVPSPAATAPPAAAGRAGAPGADGTSVNAAAQSETMRAGSAHGRAFRAPGAALPGGGPASPFDVGA